MSWLTIWWNGVLHAEFSVIDKVSLVLQLAGTTSGSIHQSAKSAIQDCKFIFLYKLRLETAQGSLHNSWGNNSLKLLTKAWLGRTICIAGLETMLVVKNKSISLLLELDSVFMSIVFEKNSTVLNPHGLLVTWLQTKNTAISIKVFDPQGVTQ